MNRKNTSDIIYEQFKTEFLNDEIEFNDKIAENDFALKYNVSRTPLREAFKRLEHEGIIVRQANGRMKVIDVSHDRINEIFNIRIALENMLFEHILDDTITIIKLKESIDLSQMYIDSNNLELAKREIANFTKILYSIESFEYTASILQNYSTIIQKLKNKTLDSNSRVCLAQEEHIKIYEALLNKDINEVQRLNRIHLSGARDQLL